MENKGILLVCNKTGRQFIGEFREKNGLKEVHNFFMLDEKKEINNKNLVPLNNIVTAENLLTCRKCGERKMGSCNCAKKYVDCSENKWNFSCAYCKELRMLSEGKQIKDLVINVTEKRYDDVEPLLNDLGLKTRSFKRYGFDCDMLFINCGAQHDVNHKELRSFVENGGSVYASDLASSTMIQAFPEIFQFRGNTGEVGNVKADVIDPELLSLGYKNFVIFFDLSAWSVLNSVKGNIILKGSQRSKYPNCPLMVYTNFGRGYIFYTCFHTHSQTKENETILLKLLLMKQLALYTGSTVSGIMTVLGQKLK